MRWNGKYFRNRIALHIKYDYRTCSEICPRHSGPLARDEVYMCGRCIDDAFQAMVILEDLREDKGIMQYHESLCVLLAKNEKYVKTLQDRDVDEGLVNTRETVYMLGHVSGLRAALLAFCVRFGFDVKAHQ